MRRHLILACKNRCYTLCRCHTKRRHGWLQPSYAVHSYDTDNEFCDIFRKLHYILLRWLSMTSSFNGWRLSLRGGKGGLGRNDCEFPFLNNIELYRMVVPLGSVALLSLGRNPEHSWSEKLLLLTTVSHQHTITNIMTILQSLRKDWITEALDCVHSFSTWPCLTMKHTELGRMISASVSVFQQLIDYLDLIKVIAIVCRMNHSAHHAQELRINPCWLGISIAML